jgi:phosphoribosyl 1,2-cyclic phosphodiesterase
MDVTFWGVRGSLPCSSPDHVRYGGNTSCVSVRCGSLNLVFDAGTGIRQYGQWLCKQENHQVALLLSHTHWDHINGFPFFSPAYDTRFNIAIYAGHLKSQGMSVKQVLESQMTAPTFPISMNTMTSNLSFTDFIAGETINIAPRVEVKTVNLNHPNQATGYRLNYQGSSVCYVTDTEHHPRTINENILNLIAGADLVIYDCTYTDQEFPARVSWGHSTWQEGVRLCQAAQAKRLAIFHHDPDHDDGFMDEVSRSAEQMWPGAFVAKEGMTLSFSKA